MSMVVIVMLIMLMLALPMTVLYIIAELICRANDRARRRRGVVVPGDAS